MKLNWSIFLSLIAATLAFIFLDQPLPAGLCALAAFIIALAKAGKKTVKAAKVTGQVFSSGVREDVSKAEGAEPDAAIFVKGVENAGDLTAQQLHAKDKQRFKYKGIGAVGEACNRLVDSFKRLFK